MLKQSCLFLMLFVVVAGCAPSVNYQPIKTNFEPLGEDVEVAVISQYEAPPSGAVVLGTLHLGDTGFSANCGFDDLLEIAANKAREAGGNAIRLFAVTPPDFSSTCYRISAQILHLSPQNIPETNRTGTGFAVSKEGTVVTAYHVIEGALDIKVYFGDGPAMQATLVKSSRINDLAVLHVDGEIPGCLSISSSATASLGDDIFTVGFPVVQMLGGNPKYSEGSISGISGLQGDDSLMQVTVPIQPGNSGGPLIGADGAVIGVITSTAAVQRFYQLTSTLPQSINWAVKSDYLLPLLNSSRKPCESQTDSAIESAVQAVCFIVAQ